MKVLLIVSLLSGLFLSCKKQEKKAPRDELSARKISQAELNIARKICSAFRVKRELFDGFTEGEAKFQFLPSSSECSGKLKDFSKISVLYDPDFKVFTVTGRAYPEFMKNIQTDTNGFLKDHCHEILDRDAGENLENIIKSGDKQFKYDFFNIKDKSSFEVTTFALRNDKWVKLFVEYFEILLDSKSSKHGMTSLRVKNSFCSNGVKILKQKLF